MREHLASVLDFCAFIVMGTGFYLVFAATS
jgi:hypothetical protein